MAGPSDIQLVQSQFDDLVARRGKSATWQAAYRCSCWNLSSDQPNYRCKACKGIGYLYQPPITEKILLQGIDTKRDLTPVGYWQTGDITASIPFNKQIQTPGPTGTIITWAPHPFWDIGMEDLIIMQDSEQRSTNILIHGQSDGKYPADTLPYPSNCIVSVMTLFVSDPVGGTVTTYTAGASGTDYTISGGVVTWVTTSTVDYCLNGNVVAFNPNGTNAKNLAQGQQYSVVYKHYPTYIVFMDLPQPRDQDAQHMPRKVILRLKDVGAR